MSSPLTRRFVVAALLSVIPACGSDSTGPSFPDLHGAFTITWTATFANPLSGGSTTLLCLGTMTISSQSEGSFSGSFAMNQGQDCAEPQSGSVTGSVRSDGSIDFTLMFTDSDPFSLTARTGCTISGPDPEYSGVFRSSELDSTSTMSVSCSGISLTIGLQITGSHTA